LIAKNWILTAAHCLQAADRQQLPGVTDPNNSTLTCPANALPVVGTTPYEGVAHWVVRWSDRDGIDSDKTYSPSIDFQAYQIPYPGYRPVTPDAIDDDHDLALLYLPHSRDGYLPPDVSKGAAAWLPTPPSPPPPSPSPPSPTLPRLRIAGYGAWESPVGNPLPRTPLTFGLAPTLNWTSRKEQVSTEVTEYDAVPCKGDSGGPLYREVQFPGEKRMIVYAVASNYKPKLNTSCPNLSNSMLAYFFYWQRVDREEVLKWINESLKRFNYEPCRRNASTSDPDMSGTLDIQECWGLPCRDESECQEMGQRCFNSGDTRPGDYARNPVSFYTCPEICGNGSCDCVVGRCVPK
jgi:hypothetical protein